MAKPRGMTENELRTLVAGHIEDAIGADDDELSERREKALAAYHGDKKQLARLLELTWEPGRSSVTSRDLSDAVGWILPSLMRVFNNGDRVVEFEPQEEGDEPFAKQATDYVNYVFSRECDGYRVIYDACHEALLFGNGIIKHWWDSSVEYRVEDYQGLNDLQFTELVTPDDVKVLQHSETVVVTEMGEMTAHDVKIRRAVREGKLRVESVPPEEFLIEEGAKSIADAAFVAHKRDVTRGALIAMGYDREKVMAIPTGDDADDEPEKLQRWNESVELGRRDISDPTMQEVEIHECYVKTDFDGDDWAEWRKVVVAGPGYTILSNDEWDEEVPFSDVQIMPQPHRWDGRSLFDELEDVLKVKTVLLRQTLDNLYLTNMPQRAVVAAQVKNMDEVLNPSIGGAIMVDTPDAIRDLAVPFVAGESFQMIAYWDDAAAKRTGVSDTSMALDPEVLQNQSATASNNAQAASYAKIELYARNIANGLRRVFRSMLRLMVKHQKSVVRMRLRDQWVAMDPRYWNADMDADVSVGLGSGSRDRDMMVLSQIVAQQKEVVAIAGPDNPICGVDKVVNTLRKMVDVAGLKNADSYFAEVTPEMIAKWQEAQGQAKPDPEVEKAKAQIEIEQAKAQAQAQLEQQKAVAKAQFDREKAAADVQTAREKHQMELQAMRERAQAEIQIAREKAQAELLLRREEMQIEAQLTAEANRMQMAVAAKQADTNVKRPE